MPRPKTVKPKPVTGEVARTMKSEVDGKVPVDELEMSKVLGSLAHRVTQLLMLSREHKVLMAERKWTAVAETLEGVAFNLERADLLLRNEARVLERAGVLSRGSSDA